MINRTVTAVLDAPKETVFAYLADVENLPEWATEFAHELRWEHGEAKVVNALGELVVRVVADARTGVIDMYAGPSVEELAFFPTRVVSLPGGRSAYSFTMFKARDMSDELFESQCESLRREFDNIRARFVAGSPSCRSA
jgi:hypothetical protein